MHSFQIFYLFLLIVMYYSFYLCYFKLFGNLFTTFIICNFVSGTDLRKWHCSSHFLFCLSYFQIHMVFSYGILVRYASGVSLVVCILYAWDIFLQKCYPFGSDLGWFLIRRNSVLLSFNSYTWLWCSRNVCCNIYPNMRFHPLKIFNFQESSYAGHVQLGMLSLGDTHTFGWLV